MRKFLTLIILLTSVALPLAAQNRGSIDGVVIDNNGKAVAGATITLSLRSDSEHSIYTTSKSNGLFEFKDIGFDYCTIAVNFIGFQEVTRKFTLDRATHSLGSITISESTQDIDEVVIETNAIRTTISGDTLIYNADAYKVSADAAAENLLAKMPGITVSDGQVETQGEQVKKVYVDGKEFFGDDVTTAIKNIPSEVIQSVEVFTKLSDNAEFTGVDDGDGYMAINFVTNMNMTGGQFGKVYGGYAHDGEEHKYQAGVSASLFTDKNRYTVIGMSNNLNQQNFGVDDILGAMSTSSSGGRRGGGGGGGGSRGGSSGSSMVSSQSGEADINSIGFNYNSMGNDNLKVEMSYFFNHTDNYKLQTTDREYLTDSDLGRYYLSESNTNTINFNHRFNGRIERTIGKNHSIMWRPSVTYQGNTSSKWGNEMNTEGEEDLNFVDSSTSSDKDGYNISSTFIYRTKFNNYGRLLTATITNNFNKNQTWSNTNYDTYLAVDGVIPDEISEYTRQRILDSDQGYRHSATLTYNEPIGDRSTFIAQYSANYNYSDADYLVYVWEQEMNKYNPDYDETLSNIYNSGYLTQSVGPGYRYYNKSKRTNFNATVSYQHSTLMNTQVEPDNYTKNYTFQNVTYNSMLSIPFSSTNTLRVYMRSSTANPSVTQLQNVLDVSNTQSISGGNEALEPSYTHNISANYVRTLLNSGRTIMLNVGGTYVQNYISTKTVTLMDAASTYTIHDGQSDEYLLTNYGQYSEPVNLDGRWTTTGSITFGTPVNFLKSNLNLVAGMSYASSPTSTINITNNIASDYSTRQNTLGYSYSASLGSNISQNVDFTLTYRGSYNITSYDDIGAAADLEDNEYLTHAASAGFKFVMPWGITLSGSGSYTIYYGVTDEYRYDYLLCNLYIGKKLFKQNRGELQVGVTDIFDQSGETFKRNITDTYIENVFNNGLGRYWGVTLTYSFRNLRGSNYTPSGRGERGGDRGGDFGGGNLGGGGGPGGGGMPMY
ncbi:MAG: outer membrane beta-barrel protein [Rikenellaceae bacterium]